MKSTGLFGKNSGRVGGIVYSNYRGQQIVRSYQPQVKNPNSKGQIEQRAKFKLVSQVGASLAKEIKMSYVPYLSKESGRNAFIREMLKKTTFSNNNATLPIDEIVITNSRIDGFSDITVSNGRMVGQISDNFAISPRVHMVVIGYKDNEEIVPIASAEPPVTYSNGVYAINYNIVGLNLPTNFTNYRVLVYVYDIDGEQGVSYSDYIALSNNATLGDVLQFYKGKLLFSETKNLEVTLSQSSND